MTDVKAPAGPKTIYCFQNGTLMFRKPNHVPQPEFSELRHAAVRSRDREKPVYLQTEQFANF